LEEHLKSEGVDFSVPVAVDQKALKLLVSTSQLMADPKRFQSVLTFCGPEQK
jgi:hypothetical protein